MQNEQDKAQHEHKKTTWGSEFDKEEKAKDQVEEKNNSEEIKYTIRGSKKPIRGANCTHSNRWKDQEKVPNDHKETNE